MSRLVGLLLLLLIIVPGPGQLQSNRTSSSSTTAGRPKPKTGRISVSYKYHNHEELSKLMRIFAKRHPQLAQLFSIGRSVEGRELWVIKLSE